MLIDLRRMDHEVSNIIILVFNGREARPKSMKRGRGG